MGENVASRLIRRSNKRFSLRKLRYKTDILCERIYTRKVFIVETTPAPTKYLVGHFVFGGEKFWVLRVQALSGKHVLFVKQLCGDKEV